MKLCAVVLAVAMLAQQTVSAQAIPRPVASRAVLDAALASSATQRAANLTKVRHLLAHPDAVRGVRHLADIKRLSERLTVLDDRTLAHLARESDAATQPSGGGGPGKVLVIVILTLVVLAIVAAALAPESS